jgi:hypothetical protein
VWGLHRVYHDELMTMVMMIEEDDDVDYTLVRKRPTVCGLQAQGCGGSRQANVRTAHQYYFQPI